ncbi:tripartite ATP-independent transporter solute receptor, DctP family [Devosia crocina]|uniref:Tripartite ATP-independent transporter solute receptor, DctP family n=1 Tax=Devosia crocina TaxID=429728 RepID=A0A1I7N7Y9_9HYPH|nr:TRAP transporter substrate-binding protein [Devosia crocina]SFV30693.1 tripartite ATP-independent transporter solute receptor, DctP family [Devosia crocina]
MRVSSFMISGAMMSALALATPALGQDYTMIMAHTLSDTNHPIYQAFQRLETEIEQRTDGRIDVLDQGGGALGSDREIMESTIFGDIQFGPMSSSAAVQFVPELAVFDIPYVMPSDTEARYQLLNQGPLADAIGAAMEAKGLKFMGIMDGGFRNLTTKNTEVHTPQDIASANLRVRVQENPIHIAIWRDLGAAPTPIAFTELYGALQQGVVDAQENPYGHILSQRFYEVQDYLINTNHILLANVSAVSLEWYNTLPEDLQAALDESFEVATRYQWDVQAELQDSQRAELEQHLTVIDLTPEELALFQEQTAGVVDMVRERAGNEIVDTLMNNLAD